MYTARFQYLSTARRASSPGRRNIESKYDPSTPATFNAFLNVAIVVPVGPSGAVRKE